MIILSLHANKVILLSKDAHAYIRAYDVNCLASVKFLTDIYLYTYSTLYIIFFFSCTLSIEQMYNMAKYTYISNSRSLLFCLTNQLVISITSLHEAYMNCERGKIFTQIHTGCPIWSWHSIYFEKQASYDNKVSDKSLDNMTVSISS